mgnify:CR=1 FL=1|jgi:phosphonopyruvate decarboxylase
MVNVKELYDFFQSHGINFFAGVPDSQLKPFCDYITGRLGIGSQHIIAANEGNAVALAAGYHLATGKIGLVYMQNSGLGNAVNPITSLADPEVYGIPVVYMIGWRGQPGVKDEPQHIKQGRITLDLLKVLEIEYMTISKDTDMEDIKRTYSSAFLPLLAQGKSVAFVVEKGSLEACDKQVYQNSNELSREKAIQIITDHLRQEDIVVSTTGKASRELFEYRENKGDGHFRDFLTVGSMGHASSIALSIAEHVHRRIWCIDGDGAVLMHLGGMAVIGNRQPMNFCHILLNNGAHESVGGMPTIAYQVNWQDTAKAFGYKYAVRILKEEELVRVLEDVNRGMEGPLFIEILANISSREDLMRPTIKPIDNKKDFMNFIGEA